MLRAFVAALFFGALTNVAAAEPTLPPYSFNIARSAQQGETVGGARGAIIYSERSIGSLAYFLADALPQGDGPVALTVDDELAPSTFGKKSSPELWHCARKFGEPVEVTGLPGKSRPTLCFRDADNNQDFETSAVGYSFGFTELGSGVQVIGAPKSIPPLRYLSRNVRPSAGEEGIVEIRFDGATAKVAKFTAIFRVANAPTSLYETHFEQPIDNTASALTIPHPVLAQPEFAVRDPKAGPIPSMTISFAAIDAKHVSGKIEAVFAEWQWYRRPCQPHPSAPAALPSPNASIPAAPSGQCETMVWRDGFTLRSVTPKEGSSSKTTSG